VESVVSDLIARARHHLLSRAELDAIADRLEHQERFDDLLEQLSAMQFAGDARYRRAVERYLGVRQRLTAVALALRVLCFTWGLMVDYLDWLVGFGEGVEWDLAFGAPEVRPEALTLAGYHLQSGRSRRLLSMLLRVAEDPGEQPVNRGDAARGLMSAVGTSPRQVPLELSLEDRRFSQVVDAARRRLDSEFDPPPPAGRRPMPRRVQLPSYVDELLPLDAAGSPFVDRARRDALTPSELTGIVDGLAHRAARATRTAQLAALLYAGDAGHAAVVEPYLDAPDPRIAGLALLVLCAGWKLTVRYERRVALLIERGDPWQRRLALTIAGGYLATRRSRSMLQLLVAVASDHHQGKEARAEALAAMYRATDGFPGGLVTDLDLEESEVTWRETGRRLLSE
jgi:hypothetical protein